MTGSLEAQQSTDNALEDIHEPDEREGASIPLSDINYLCIPLLSGIVGYMQNKYLPTGDMSGCDLRLEITLANVFDGVVTTGWTSTGFLWTMDNVELMFEYVELDSEISKIISTQNVGAT